MSLHVDAAPAKGDAFGLQQESLFETAFTRNFDDAACSDYTLPRQASRIMERSRDLAGSARIARGPGDRSIAGNFPARNS